jgi:heme A synthase
VVLYNYYSTIAGSFAVSSTNLTSMENTRVYNHFLLAHLVFKNLVKIAVWLWNKVDKLPKEESEKQVLWVRLLGFVIKAHYE